MRLTGRYKSKNCSHAVCPNTPCTRSYPRSIHIKTLPPDVHGTGVGGEDHIIGKVITRELEKILQRCRATSVVFSDAFSHQSLCTPPTMLQFAMAGRPSISSRRKIATEAPHTSDVDGSTRTELPRAKEEGRSIIPRSPQEQDMKGQRPSLFYYAMMDEDGNRCRGVFGFRLDVLYQARLVAGTVAMIS